MGDKQDHMLLHDNIELLLQHTEAIIQYQPYYYSRIVYDGSLNKWGDNEISSILLGPWVEFWKKVHVNNIGKLVFTYNHLNDSCWHSDGIIDIYGDHSIPVVALFREKAGFFERHPIPGIEQHQLQDIYNRYMMQFDKQDLPIGAPLSVVVKEIKEGMPESERPSQSYNKLREKLYSGVAAILHTNTFEYIPFSNDTLGWGRAPYHPLQKPITFRLHQEKDLSFNLYLDLAVPARYYESDKTGIRKSSGPVEHMDLLNQVFSLLDGALQDSGFMKLNASVTLGAIGIDAQYKYPVLKVTDLVKGDAIERLARLLQYLHSIIEKEDLLPVRG